MQTDDIAAWLTAIWDQDEALQTQLRDARVPVRWIQSRGEVFSRDDGRLVVARLDYNTLGPVGEQLAAEHIARHDPAAELARFAADREILADYQAEVTRHRERWERQLARPASELHAECAHPHYEYARTEGQRKAWDDADVPPISHDTWEPEPGWERNVDEGRDGWERFDYTEESYWRRLLPEEKWRNAYVPPVPRHIKHLASAYADRPGYNEDWRPARLL